MVRNLMKAGYPVNVLTRTRSRIEDLLADGAIWCETPKEIAQKSDVVITMLPDTPDVEWAFSGKDGILDGVRPGMLLIDMSTVSPIAVRRLAREARVRDCSFLDAPVSGGEIGAQNGTLSIMAGGEESAFKRAIPVFQVLGKTILLIGDAGAGQITKAANQILTSVTTEAVAEALVFAAKAGVDPAKVRQALMGGSASSRILDTHGEKMLARNFKPGFRMRLHRKDLDITLEAAETYGAALPVTKHVRELMNETIEDGQGDMDNSSFLLLLEKLSEQRGTAV
jgi:2-hydroxy-3-oxopropionate reductase